MTDKKSGRHERDAEAKQLRSAVLSGTAIREQICIDVGRSGEWMPVEDLREAALSALAAGNDVTVNLVTIEHLDASSLQILLAFGTEQSEQGRQFRLANVSPNLRQWFEYAGAADQFSMAELNRDE
jgi:anti-anti-sigma regulatory factor